MTETTPSRPLAVVLALGLMTAFWLPTLAMPTTAVAAPAAGIVLVLGAPAAPVMM